MRSRLSSVIISICTLLLLLFYTSRVSGAERSDTLTFKYQKEIESLLSSTPHQVDSLIKASRTLIESAQNRDESSIIAGLLFNRFSNSPIMGDESIAVAIAKEYFLNSKLEWRGDGGTALLKLYVEFNEKSLIGMEAPPLNLYSVDGEAISLHTTKGRYTLLFFFDPSCQVCNSEFPKIIELLSNFSQLNISLFVVNSASDSTGTDNYIAQIVDSTHNFAEWQVVWNPFKETDFYRDYNLVSLPQIYLLDREKVIIGRNLNHLSLNALLESLAQKDREMSAFYDQFIPTYLSLFDFSKEGSFEKAFEPLYQKVILEDIELFHTLFLNLFLTLAHSQEQLHKEVAYRLASRYIVEKRELWGEQGFIETLLPMMLRRIEQNRIGAHLPKLSFKDSKGKERKIGLKKKGYQYIYFFTPDCPICIPFTEEIKKISGELKRKKVEVVAIYWGASLEDLQQYLKHKKLPYKVLYYPKESDSPLIEHYELEALPMTYLIDSRGQIVEKGINTIQLQKFLKE